jgi:hypothetical protein
VSDATFQLLTSTAFITAIAIGALGVAIVLVWAIVTKRPSPAGGVILTTAIVVSIVRAETIPTGLLIGLGVLAGAGLVPVRSLLARMAIVIPGAVIVAMTQIDNPRGVAAALVAVTIILLAPLVASFDDRYAETTVATPLLAISMVSVFLTVPDTKFVLLAAGASLPWIIAGPPARLARLGQAGSFAAVGMLAWLVATGGFARPVSLAAGIATLGVLIIEPVVSALRGRRGRASDGKDRVSSGTVTVLVASQIAIQAVIAVVVRI